MKLKETDLFPPVKQLLEEWGFEVYSEVQPRQGGKRADLVGVSWPVVAVVELKTQMSLDLLDQALGWIGYANYVYIAVPKLKRRHDTITWVLQKEGIGLIEICDYWDGNKPRCFTPAKLHRKICLNWRTIIKDEHRNGPPGGSNGGGYITDYSITMANVRLVLGRAGEIGMTVREILEHCETHYRQPRSSLANALLKFEGGWCERFTGKDGKTRFRVKSKAG